MLRGWYPFSHSNNLCDNMDMDIVQHSGCVHLESCSQKVLYSSAQAYNYWFTITVFPFEMSILLMYNLQITVS